MAPVRKRTRLEQARQFLAGGAVPRDDSDDELGYDDFPWEWIYDGEGGKEQTVQNGTPRKRKAAPAVSNRRIVGARMGNFVCKQGDAVLLKAEGNQAWVGLICDFFEDEDGGEKMAKFMWFSSEKEIRNKGTKRTDFLTVRLFGTCGSSKGLTSIERALHIPRLRRECARDHQWDCKSPVPRRISATIPLRR
jgi:origin recognition complex subunit 1